LNINFDYLINYEKINNLNKNEDKDGDVNWDEMR